MENAIRPFSPLRHPDDQIQPPVANKGPDLIPLDHHRREEGKHLLVKVTADKFLMEWLDRLALVKIDILAVQLGQDLLRENTIIGPLLAVHLVGNGRQDRLGFGTALIRETFLHHDRPMLSDPDLIKFLQVRRVDRQELNPLIDRQTRILGLQQNTIVEGEPADIPL